MRIAGQEKIRIVLNSNYHLSIYVYNDGCMIESAAEKIGKSWIWADRPENAGWLEAEAIRLSANADAPARWTYGLSCWVKAEYSR